jgi:hypothetical protein
MVITIELEDGSECPAEPKLPGDEATCFNCGGTLSTREWFACARTDIVCEHCGAIAGNSGERAYLPAFRV